MSQTNSQYERDELDFYVEPAWCVEALLIRERFTGLCYDPACGIGTIPLCCTDFGLACAYGDKIARIGSLPHIVPRDFLTDPLVGPTPYNIICNPPFRWAVPFVIKALEIAKQKVAMLFPLTILASQKRKSEIFDPFPPARVYVLSRRPSMPPGQFYIDDPDYKAKGGSVDYCWIVWDHGAKGTTQMEWLA